MSLLHLHEVAYFVEQRYYCEWDAYFADKKVILCQISRFHRCLVQGIAFLGRNASTVGP